MEKTLLKVRTSPFDFACASLSSVAYVVGTPLPASDSPLLFATLRTQDLKLFVGLIRFVI